MPYNQDDSFFLSPGTMMIGAGMFAGAAMTGRYLKNRENAIFSKLDSYDYMRKKAWWQKAKDWRSKNPGVNGAGGFWKNMLETETMHSWKSPRNNSLTAVRKGIYDTHSIKLPQDIAMYFPRTRAANSIDRTIHKVWGRKLGENARVMKASGAMAFGLMTINDAMNEHGLLGVPIGAAREVGAQVGARVGMSAGSSAMFAAAGKFPGAGFVGKFSGMALGGMAGFMAVDSFMKLSKLGRKWSMPELGGNFQDSETAMTMRQRSLNAISTSQMNLRSELGREALTLRGL